MRVLVSVRVHAHVRVHVRVSVQERVRERALVCMRLCAYAFVRLCVSAGLFVSIA